MYYNYNYNANYYQTPSVYLGKKLLNNEQKLEKRSLRRVSNILGFTLLISNLAIAILALIPNLISLLFKVNMEFLNDEVVGFIVQILFSTLMFTIPFIIASKLICKYDKSTMVRPVSFKKPKLGISVAVICVALGLFILGDFTTGIINNILTQIRFPSLVQAHGLPNSFLGKIMFIITISALPALIEEFAFRGVILGSLRRYGDTFAIVCSAVLFGLMHGNTIQTPFAFVAGLGLGYACVVTRSIWPGVIAHFLNNFLSAMMSFLPDNMAYISNYVYSFLFMILGIVGLFLLLKYNKRPFKMTGKGTALSNKQKSRVFFSSVGVVLACSLFLFTIFATGLIAIFLKLVTH